MDSPLAGEESKKKNFVKFQTPNKQESQATENSRRKPTRKKSSSNQVHRSFVNYNFQMATVSSQKSQDQQNSEFSKLLDPKFIQ